MRGRIKRRRMGTSFAIESLERRIVLDASPASVTGLTLIDARTEQPIASASLAPGALIDLGAVGHRLSIRADLSSGTVGSVRFNLDGNPDFQIDNAAPYDIGGDKAHGTKFLPWLPTVGMHTLITTPYAGKNGTGQIGQSYITLFNVIDSSTPAAPFRVNAGGGKYTDSSGATFSADMNYSGGWPQTDNTPIAGTLDAALYQTRRSGPGFVYSKRLPDDTYAVTLYMEDPTVDGGKNTDVFNVSTDTSTLLDHYDIAADVGAHTAVQKTFIVPVTSGKLNLYFDAQQGYAMVSAISVVAQRTPLTESPMYVNAGGVSYTDSLARTFEPGTGFSGGTTSQTPFALDEQRDAPEFYDLRSGSHFTFSQPIANGNYQLWLNFAEPAGTAAGQRVFNVTANGATILDHYDIVADNGAGIAVAKTFDLQITGGRIDLAFDGVVGDAVVSSIVLIPKDVAPVAVPYSDKALPDSLKMRLDQQNLVNIGLCSWLYAQSQPRMRQPAPPDLAALVAATDLNPSNLADPRTDTATPQGELNWQEKSSWAVTLDDYIYLGAGRSLGSLGAQDPLAYDNPDRVSGDINILFADGHVAEYTREQASRLLGIQIGNPTHAPPTPVAPQPDVKVLISQVNLRTIGVGDFYYGIEQTRNGEAFAPDLGTIASSQGIDASYFLNPRGHALAPPANMTPEEKAAWVNANTDYVYTGFHKNVTAEYDALLAYENPAEMAGGIDMLTGDAIPKFRDMRWAIETILADRAGGRSLS